MIRTKYMPSEHLLLASQQLRDDYNHFVRHLVQQRRPLTNQRYVLAEKYLSECKRGIEVGGFHAPNHLPQGCEADYVDQVSVETIKKRFPEFDDFNCVFPLYLDNGEKLSSIPTKQYDFLIANHMIEHAEDTIKTIQNHLRVIKANGYLFYAVPDKNHTFDIDRDLTTFEHLEDEYFNGSEKNRKAHYADVITNIAHAKVPEEQFEEHLQSLLQKHLDTHFHVWEYSTFEEHLHQMIAKKYINAKLVDIAPNGTEFICVLQKLPL